jgi:chromosome segregation ATPase
LVDGLDELTVDRNDLQEKINKISSDKHSSSSLLSRIDEWQQVTIENVKQAAQQARQQVLKIMNSKQEEIKRQFQTLSQEFEQLRETEGVLEQDLARLKQQIGQLNNDLEQLSQPSTVELNMKQSDQIMWNRLICVEEKSERTVDQQHQPQPRGEHLNKLCNEFFKHRFFY